MNLEELRSQLFSGLSSESKNPPSAFLDQGETHLFSDWLAVSLWNVGVDDPKEFYVGVFPDLSDFLTRDRGRVAIDANALKMFYEKSMTDFQTKMKAAVAGKYFVDLGAGRPSLSVMPRLVAQLMGAKAYIGIDLCYSGDSLRKNEFSELGSFESYFLRNDWLEALAHLKTSEPIFCFAAGAELAESDSKASLEAKQKALEGFTKNLKPNDFVLFGAGTTDFDWKAFPFKKTYSDHYHFLHRRLGPWPWSRWF